MSVADRRPLASRDTAWARRVASLLARSSITPNQISTVSIVFAALGGWALVDARPLALIGAAISVQLRLLCNLIDGMVAIEGGKQSATGALYNEFPDRIEDSLLLVAAGCATGWPELGWCAALLAMATAYLRALGGVLFLLGALIMAYNLYMTIASPEAETEAGRGAAPSLVPAE